MFRIPNETERTVVVGMTGSGKTQGSAFLLSRMRFEEMPWIILDFKRESLFQDFNAFSIVGTTPPRDPGIYIFKTGPDDLDNIEALFLQVHARGDCGVFVDEGMELGHSRPFRTLLTQGRSLNIPMIVCTQRPAHVTRSVFTEANFFMIYHMNHPEDQKLVAGYVGETKSLPPLPRYHSYWYDVVERQLLKMRPVPDRLEIAETIAQKQDALMARQKARNYL